MLIWLALKIIPPLSPRGVLRLSRFIADTVFLFDRCGRRVSAANLRLICGRQLPTARERAIIRKSYRNMARVMVNVFWMSRDTLQRMQRHVRVSPMVLEQLIPNQPVITVSGHIGNWEILSQACIINGVPIMSVAKELGSPRMTRRLTKLRSSIGQQIVSAEGALRSLMKALKRGVSIGLLIDQHTYEHEGGVWVKFFGRSVGISLAPAALARKFGAPILFAWSHPRRNGDYYIRPGCLLPPDGSVSDVERTQELITAFERVIRRHPSLWCLNYRRWRHILPGEDKAIYPYYARHSKGT